MGLTHPEIVVFSIIISESHKIIHVKHITLLYDQLKFLVILLFLYPCTILNCNNTNKITAQEIEFYTYDVIERYPHNTNAFTQGLVYADGYIYEGTGRYGQSSIKKIDMTTGQVIKQRALDPQYFGEGITIFDGKLIQLTWTSQIGFVYDKNSFDLLESFHYPTQGWGLTHNQDELIMSDGSNTLYYMDPHSYQITGQIQVTYNGDPVYRINELEYIQGMIYANVYQTDNIIQINPHSGAVTAWINMEGLVSSFLNSIDSEAVLNGIAYDEKEHRIFVTGKLWPTLFEVRFVEANSPN